jgi:hypothetical protein
VDFPTLFVGREILPQNAEPFRDRFTLCISIFPASRVVGCRKSPYRDMILSSDADTVAPFQLSDIDRRQLASTDESFNPHTWDELKVIIGLPWLLLMLDNW